MRSAPGSDRGLSILLLTVSTLEMTPQAKAVLRAFAALAERREAPTVHAAALQTRLTFMDVYDHINALFGAGYLTADLQVTDAGRRAAK